jgi:hypothetical protein
MIDWLASKVGVLIAVGVITVFVLGLFAWQHSAMVDREGQAVADSVSGILDSVANLEAGTELNISFGDSGQLPQKIGGESYTVNITGDRVIVRAGNRMWMSQVLECCVPRNITERHMNLTEFGEMDLSGWTGEHESSGSFTVERAAVDVSGKTEYLTLVYWDEG